jgi:hypothetical protein
VDANVVIASLLEHAVQIWFQPIAELIPLHFLTIAFELFLVRRVISAFTK